jgi:hypothetical protein
MQHKFLDLLRSDSAQISEASFREPSKILVCDPPHIVAGVLADYPPSGADPRRFARKKTVNDHLEFRKQLCSRPQCRVWQLDAPAFGEPHELLGLTPHRIRMILSDYSGIMESDINW